MFFTILGRDRNYDTGERKDFCSKSSPFFLTHLAFGGDVLYGPSSQVSVGSFYVVFPGGAYHPSGSSGGNPEGTSVPEEHAERCYWCLQGEEHGRGVMA